jgi:hypothetical protein
MVSGLVHLDTAPDAAMALHEGINEMALKETSPLSSPTSPAASNDGNEQSDDEQMPRPVNLVTDIDLVAELDALDGKRRSGKLLMITLHACWEILTLSFQSARPKHQSAPRAAPHSKPKPRQVSQHSGSVRSSLAPSEGYTLYGYILYITQHIFFLLLMSHWVQCISGIPLHLFLRNLVVRNMSYDHFTLSKVILLNSHN